MAYNYVIFFCFRDLYKSGELKKAYKLAVKALEIYRDERVTKYVLKLRNKIMA